MQAQEKLGTISFPNSGNAAAQEPFLRGMKLYWSFEYDRAAAAFQEAQKADPSMTLAYVGEALTYTHQVWNQQNAVLGRRTLEKFGSTTTQRLEKARTPRERMYGELAEVLYGDGSKPRRDTQFVSAAERLVRANPSDDEAKVFHAIGLLGLNQSVRDSVTYMRAGAIAEEVFKRNPDHPGAAHFVIHAYDDPMNAPRGLAAARAYSKIAPSAPHAVHMTTHIFVALGMWDDVIEQNTVASGHDHDKWVPGHYTLWLGYGYLQAGRLDDAQKHIALLAKNAGTSARPGVNNALATLHGHYYFDAGVKLDDAALMKLAPAQLNIGFAGLKLANGFELLRKRERDAAETIAAELEKGAAEGFPGDRSSIAVIAKELRAKIASQAGRHEEAIRLAREAADAEDAMPYEFGPPQFVKPTFELLGEILLEAEKGKEAQAAFSRALARTPGRAVSLLGLANAAMLAGDRATATTAVATLKANWHAADAKLRDLPMFGKRE